MCGALKRTGRGQELLEDCWHKDAAKRPKFKEIIERLDQLMIDVAITDPNGNAFWVQHLKGREHLSWDRFAAEVCKCVACLWGGGRRRLSRNHRYLGWGAEATLDADKSDLLRYFRYMTGVAQSDVQVPPREVTLVRVPSLDGGRFDKHCAGVFWCHHVVVRPHGPQGGVSDQCAPIHDAGLVPRPHEQQGG